MSLNEAKAVLHLLNENRKDISNDSTQESCIYTAVSDRNASRPESESINESVVVEPLAKRTDDEIVCPSCGEDDKYIIIQME